MVSLIDTGAVAATTCLVLASAGHSHGALVLASSAVGALALVGGVVVLTPGREAREPPSFRGFAGVASLLYSARVVVNAGERRAGSTAAPTAGSFVALAAMPSMLAVIVTLPRSTGAAVRPSGLLADADVGTSAAALVSWQTVLATPGATLGAGRRGVGCFGTGFSSLAYLTRLPVHVLKIDRSLTVSLDDRGASAVVQAAAAMAEGMGPEVIAEGVEDASQPLALVGMGIGAGQGWLWSPALPEAEAIDLVLRGRALGPSSDDASRTRGSTSLVSDVAGS